MFDIYTIIFLALAVFIFLRLRSVLGQRTGRERPPYDPYSSAPRHHPAGAGPGDKVVTLPGRAPDAAQKTPSRLSRSTAGRVSLSQAPHWRPVSTPSRARTRASTPSTS